VKRNPTLILSVAAFALFSAVVGTRLLYPLDARILEAAQGRTSGVLDVAGMAFSVLGGGEFVGVAALALAAALALTGRRVLAVRFLVALVATGLVELALKEMLPQVPVPDEATRTPDPSVFDIETSYPYPSGHMLRSVILLGALCVLWPRPPVLVAVILLLACSAASRVYLGTHWPSDVIGGALLGVAGLAWAFGGRPTVGQRPNDMKLHKS
jgi:membrane-associated phospholipid phosphatase